MTLMVKVEFRCPSCKKVGLLDVESELLKHTERGLLAITVPSGKLCSHSFVAYIDKNLDTRDCYLADFMIEIPQLDEEESEEIFVPEINVPEIEIVKLTLPASVIVYIIRAVLLKKKVLLVSDKKHLYDHYHKFFDYITQNSFNIDLSFTSKILYKLNRNEFQDRIVIGENKEIVRDIHKIINPKNVKIEKRIVHEFFENIDIVSSFIILRNEVKKIFIISNKLSEIAEKYHISELINQDEIHESLEDISTTKLQSDFLNLLIDVVEEYFGMHVPMSLKILLKKWKKKKK